MKYGLVLSGGGGKGGYQHGDIDWDEFWRAVKGDGVMSVERVEMRKAAWDDGAWVRDAALAHAEKRAEKLAAE